MKIKWADFIEEGSGSLDHNHYIRHIPGDSVWAALCAKPELKKKEKKKRAEHPTALHFGACIAESKAILCDAVRRAAWQAKYDEVVRQARRHGKRTYGRLCDYVRHEVSTTLKEGRVIEP